MQVNEGIFICSVIRVSDVKGANELYTGKKEISYNDKVIIKEACENKHAETFSHCQP